MNEEIFSNVFALIVKFKSLLAIPFDIYSYLQTLNESVEVHINLLSLLL